LAKRSTILVRYFNAHSFRSENVVIEEDDGIEQGISQDLVSNGFMGGYCARQP
jgi:hypothetical protein